MVFVSMVLFTSILFFSAILAADWYFTYKKFITLGELRRLFLTVHLNVMYIYILVFFASLSTSKTP